MREVKIKIIGKQIDYSGEEDTIELVTEGKFYKKSRAYYLVYDESEISGMEGFTTTLKIEQNKVIMKRFGPSNSNLIFEKGIKHKSDYHTAYGDMDIEVLTNKIDININDTGKGSINLEYKLNISSTVQSNNKLSISVM